ncbi:motility associated factor glycosyltransferase family protein [Pelosinus fermentans]|uniref:motility associated factor glycosyltransferase family protein n=1 Tax=Pelosinus fermentans TaxID=365349 RepID=UPI0022A9A2E4|nr:6-hydroxymethylpterin diphosphokinase MptE-like protein [Pelosinus fermentans]
MQDSWEEQNWKIYKERYGIERTAKMPDYKHIEIVDSRVGMPTAKVMASNGKWIFLHSSVDPIKEAQKNASTVSTEPGKFIIVYGFALGYLVEALLEIVDKKNLLFIIEPDYDLFCAVMASRDLRHLLGNENIYILVADSISRVNNTFFTIYNEVKYNQIIMTGLLGHQTVYSDFYQQSMKSVKDIVNSKVINIATMMKIGPNLIANSLLNLSVYCRNPGISSLFNQLKDLPVIIVAAGPSLNKNIHLLKEAKGRAAIFAVGTAVKALNKWGIEPDFIFSVDPQRLNYDLHFKGANTAGAVLVSEIQSHPMIFENHQGPIFVSGHMPIINWFGDSIERKGLIESGGSVANNAFVVAHKMGANPIILVGQDLAYARDGHTHATGTNYENNKYTGGKNQDYFDVKANDGGKILTDRAFYQFLHFFETWIEKYPECKYINATEGGAFIQGTTLMKLQEVLDQYCQEPIEIQEMIKTAQDSFCAPNKEQILEKLELRLIDTRGTIAEANKALKHLMQLEKACDNRQGKKMQQHLKAVSKIYEKFEKDQQIREIAEWFVQKELYGVFARTHEAERSETDEYSHAIADYSLYYRKIIEAAKSLADLIQQSMDKFRRKIDNDC